MIEIVFFILGALAFLALGIANFTNKKAFQKYLRDQNLPQETVNIAGALLIIASIIYFIASGEEKIVICCMNLHEARLSSLVDSSVWPAKKSIDSLNFYQG